MLNKPKELVVKCKPVCYAVVADITRNSVLNWNDQFERIPGQNGIARFKTLEGKDWSPL